MKRFLFYWLLAMVLVAGGTIAVYLIVTSPYCPFIIGGIGFLGLTAAIGAAIKDGVDHPKDI